MRSLPIALATFLVLLGCGSGGIEGIRPPDDGDDGDDGLPDDPDADDRGDPDAGDIAITSPEDNVLTAAPSIEVTGVVREGDFAEVDINGVTAQVQPDGTFSALVGLEEGRNEIHARAGSADAWIVVRRDTISPAIHLDSPARGAFINAVWMPEIELIGSIEDAHGLSSVTVNGAPAIVDELGAFRFLDASRAYGVHYYSIEVTDNAGNVGATGLSVLYGEYSPPTVPVTDAVVALAGPSVLGAVAQGAQDMLADVDLEAAAMAANPIVEEWWATVNVTSVTRGDLLIDLVPTEAGLEVEVTLSDIDVGFHVDLPGPWNPDGTAWADAAVLSGVVDVWATESGTIDAALIESSVVLQGFGFDVAPTGIEDVGFIRDAVEGQIRGAVQSEVETRVPAVLADQLSALDLSRSLEMGGISLWIDVVPTRLEIDRGGVTLHADGSLWGDDAGVTPTSPGTLRTPSDSPALTGDGMTVSFADDTINQVLSAAWKAGLLDREIALATANGPVTVGAVTLLFPALVGVAPAETQVIATLDPLLPPVAMFDEQGAELSIGELHVKLEADTPGGRTDLVTLALNITASLAADFGDGASVSLSILDYSLTADPVEAPEGFPQGDEFHELMQAVVEMMGPEFEAPLASLPLPGFMGFRFSGLDAVTDGARGDYLTLSCDVTYQ
ncbi:MAG: hypothetical protein HYY06_22045 [Deltaproteobacteria bacterium]|nr:hypothetical protein [Deltaproteobacteria bacterium]